MEDDPFDELIEWQMMEDYIEDMERQNQPYDDSGYDRDSDYNDDYSYLNAGQQNAEVSPWVVIGAVLLMIFACVSML